MQPKHHAILYIFLSLSLVVAVFLAFDYAVASRQAEDVLEDGYAQRVMEAQEHLQAIGLKLGKLAAAAEPRTQIELLSGASRQADGVVTGLSALPLSHVAMSDTIKFCNQLSEYTMGLALNIASGEALGEEAFSRLTDMENQCSLLLGQFATAQDLMLRESLRLAGAQNIYYEEAQLAARPLEQVADADNGMDYPSMIYDGAFSDARHFGAPKALGDARVNAAQAVEIAKQYVGEARVSKAAAGAETAGALESFGVTLTLKDGVVLNAEVTKQGGKLLWMVPEHAAFTPGLSVKECIGYGEAFLARHGYGEMEANHYQVYDGLAVINFVSLQDGVLLYPDLVKVQVRMDTGEVVGMEANNYLMNHTARSIPPPTLSEEEALNKVSPRLNATGARLCIIPYRDTERLCYEATGEYGGREYRVYIDAQTGEEAQVLMMLNTADGQMSA